MVDSEYTYVIFAATLVMITVFLISSIPAAFLVEYDSPDALPDVPEWLDPYSIVAWNSTYVIAWANLTADFDPFEGVYRYVSFWGKEQFGHDMKFEMTNSTPNYYVKNIHGDYPWWGGGSVFSVWHEMNWVSEESGLDRGTTLTLSVIEGDMGSGSQASYRIYCSDFYMYGVIAYDENSYGTVQEAWDNNGMALVFGIDWDQQGTVHDAWSLVAAIFNLSADLTGNAVADYFIRIPVIAGGAIVIYFLITKAIGSIFG